MKGFSAVCLLLVGATAVLSAPTAHSGANASGSVFVSPSPIDASRDTKVNANMPGTENGAWVLQNAGGVVGDHRDQPLGSTSTNDMSSNSASSSSSESSTSASSDAAAAPTVLIETSDASTAMAGSQHQPVVGTAVMGANPTVESSAASHGSAMNASQNSAGSDAHTVNVSQLFGTTGTSGAVAAVPVVAVQASNVQPVEVRSASIQPVAVQSASVQPVAVHPVVLQNVSVQPVAVAAVPAELVAVHGATAAPSALQGSDTAVVSAQVNNQRSSQAFQVGDGPIVAVLPAGSNLSATWDTSSGQQPVIGFANLPTTSTQATLLAVPVAVAAVPVATVEAPSVATTQATAATVVVSSSTATLVAVTDSSVVSVIESSPASVVSGVDLSQGTGVASGASSSSASGVNNVPVILPVGVTLSQANMANHGNMGATGAAVPVRVGSAGSNTIGMVNQAGNPLVQQNHRVEFELVDFQMNSSTNSNLNQAINITVQITAGALPPAVAINQNMALGTNAGATVNGQPAIVMHMPETTSGVQNVFNGNYVSSNNNKVSVSKTITLDLCGAISDKAFMQVTVNPITGFTCAVNINFPTAARSTEAFWSDPLQCNSGDMQGYSFRLWYRVRNYNIDWAQCQQNRPAAAGTATA
ncbi:hypothetical protein RvY_08070 [Ramazzottius varieornatus]|uniref:Uncharacterized protein n=1 Tax=Ramazzottius varieornatus TaxID=947166 RepID=A0A1D1V9B0_RAMVA|nr:hypothetical protein RvY_08070 [Ramazzottius varieornatus]